MSCNDAIAMGDGRELFVIQVNFEIKSFIDDYCLQTKNGMVNPETELELMNCLDSSRHEDNR